METVDAGSTPVLYSEFKSDLTVETDASLEITLGIETSNKRNDMKIGTKLTFGTKSRVMMKVVFTLMIMGLLGFVTGPVPPLA